MCTCTKKWPTFLQPYYTSDRYHSSCTKENRIPSNPITIYRVWRFSLSLIKQEWCSIVAELQLVHRYHLYRWPGIPSLCSHVCHRRDFIKINLKPLIQIIRQTCPCTSASRSLFSVQSRSLWTVLRVPFWRSSYLRVCNSTTFHTKSLHFVYRVKKNRNVQL